MRVDRVALVAAMGRAVVTYLAMGLLRSVEDMHKSSENNTGTKAV